MEKEAKKEAFRKYLESSGVLDALTKVLVALYEQNDKPSSALEFIQQKMGGPSLSEYEKLQAENSDLQIKYNELLALHQDKCREDSVLGKRSAEASDEEALRAQKKREEALAIGFPANQGVSTSKSTFQDDAELILIERARLSIEVNAQVLSKLENLKEIGFARPPGKKKLEMLTFNLDVEEIRRCITDVMTSALKVRFLDQASYRMSEITSEIKDIVPLIVDACMSALYAKLRNIHRAHGKLATRYTSHPLYTEEVELPLPLALAIQEIGTFETHSYETNYIMAPTYPEGTPDEGRKNTHFNITDYQSCIPIFRMLGIPCKTVDTFVKKGSAWWTYIISNAQGTTDLKCMLPPTHYSDYSASLRALFLAPKSEKDPECNDIIKYEGSKIVDYGVRLREMLPHSNVKAFFALAHGTQLEWSLGNN